MDEIVGTLEVPRWILAEKEAKAAVADGQMAGTPHRRPCATGSPPRLPRLFLHCLQQRLTPCAAAGEEKGEKRKRGGKASTEEQPEDKAAAPVEQAPSRKSLEKMTVPQARPGRGARRGEGT
jgi:hypothetical protein